MDKTGIYEYNNKLLRSKRICLLRNLKKGGINSTLSDTVVPYSTHIFGAVIACIAVMSHMFPVTPVIWPLEIHDNLPPDIKNEDENNNVKNVWSLARLRANIAFSCFNCSFIAAYSNYTMNLLITWHHTLVISPRIHLNFNSTCKLVCLFRILVQANFK